MPLGWTLETHEEKNRYLRDLFSCTYIRDVFERNQIKKDEEVLEILLSALASGSGSLTNPSRLANTFESERQIRIAPDTIDKYIELFRDAFLIQKAESISGLRSNTTIPIRDFAMQGLVSDSLKKRT